MGASHQAGGIAVLASGGVDSACLIEWAGRRTRGPVVPIYVSFGLQWESSERRALTRFLRVLSRRRPNLRPAVTLHLPAKDIYANHWSLTGRGVPGRRSQDAAVYLPGRNLLILSKAAVYCARRGIGTMAIGTLASNPFPDATPEFFSKFSTLASAALGRRIRVLAPFLRYRKSDLIRRYSHLPLQLCFSCLKPVGRSGRACGRCNKCVEWRRAARN